LAYLHLLVVARYKVSVEDLYTIYVKLLLVQIYFLEGLML